MEKLSQLAVKFLPLIKRWCKHYFEHTNGIEYNELFQEAVMALYELLKGHEEDEEYEIKQLVGNNMQGIIRDMADRMHSNLYVDYSLEAETESGTEEELCPALLIPDEENRQFAQEETELFVRLKRLLTAEEYRLAELKYAGRTNSDISRLLGISRAAVIKKLKKLGEKVKNAITGEK